jgi:hypothetical protein
MTTTPQTATALVSPAQRDLSVEQLDYMADLVAELRDMAQGSGLTTLASILSLAQVEAALQSAKKRQI